MTTKPNTEKCETCGTELNKYRMKMHRALKHPELFIPIAELSDMKTNLARAEARIEELQSATLEAQAELSDTERVAVLSDWIERLTPEAWQLIGSERGFTNQPEIDAAELNDFPPKSKVLILDNGIVISRK